MNQSTSWVTIDDLPEAQGDRAPRPDVVESAIAFASDVLYNLTGRRWAGVRTDRYRPCCGCTPSDCACEPGGSILLPNTPAVAVTQIKIDGQVIASSEYELRDRRRIVAVRQPDGTRRTFLQCQDLTRPTTDVGTMEVVYTWGSAPPDAGKTACGILAWEFALAWTPALAGMCRLPRRVTSITRAGMTVAAIDPLSLFEKGLTGIPEVDVWTKSLEYGTNRTGARVLVPGQHVKATRATP